MLWSKYSSPFFFLQIKELNLKDITTFSMYIQIVKGKTGTQNQVV